MNIIEALKSDKPLRRKDKPVRDGANMCGYYDAELLLANFNLTKDDMVADDWEIQEPMAVFCPLSLSPALRDIYLKDRVAFNSAVQKLVDAHIKGLWETGNQEAYEP
jgi:hypothetical protein